MSDLPVGWDDASRALEKKVKVPKETLAEIEELKATIRGLTRQYDEASAENLELKSRMAKVELELTGLVGLPIYIA